MTHDEKVKMRNSIYGHLELLLDKVHRMFEQGDLSISQMSVGADILKDIAKADKALSAACYYESQHDAGEDKRY